MRGSTCTKCSFLIGPRFLSVSDLEERGLIYGLIFAGSTLDCGLTTLLITRLIRINNMKLLVVCTLIGCASAFLPSSLNVPSSRIATRSHATVMSAR